MRSIRCCRRGVLLRISGPLLVELGAPEHWRERETLAFRVCRTARPEDVDVAWELVNLVAGP